jgi:thiamine transport system substrate-binding protein
MQRSVTRGLFAVTAAASALALSGCTLAATGTGGGTSATESGSASGTVTFLTHDSFGVSDELIAQFEESTGYDLVITSPGDAGVITSQLLLAGDAPGVDGVYGIDNYSAATVLDAGVLAPYSSPNLPASAESLALGDALTPIDQGQVCVNIDHAWFEEQGMAEPTTLDELAQPEYAELLALTNPTTSSPGLAFLVATVGEYGDGWQDYWQQLLDGGAKIEASWSDVYYVDFSGAEGEGEFPLVLSYSSSPAEAGGATGVLDASCTTQVEYAGVTAGAENPEGAQAFIDTEFQQALPEGMYMYPVDESVELPSEWAEHASLVDDPIDVDPAEVAEHRDTWLEEWTALYEAR